MRLWLTPDGARVPPPEGADARLPVTGGWLYNTRIGDFIKFTDAHAASRSLKVVGAAGQARLA